MLRREIKSLEKGLSGGGGKKKLYKRPEVGGGLGGGGGSLYIHEEFSQAKEMIWDLRKFNAKAEEVIKELAKEIESDTFKYDI